MSAATKMDLERVQARLFEVFEEVALANNQMRHDPFIFLTVVTDMAAALYAKVLPQSRFWNTAAGVEKLASLAGDEMRARVLERLQERKAHDEKAKA